MKQRTPEEIMERMGFAATSTGPYGNELRSHLVKQVAEGLVNRSAGSWDGWPDDETRARELLAMEWALARGHSARTEVMDGLWYWQTDIRTMTRTLTVRWRSFPAWVGDRWRVAGMNWRVFRDRKLLRLRNPYSVNS